MNRLRQLTAWFLLSCPCYAQVISGSAQVGGTTVVCAPVAATAAAPTFSPAAGAVSDPTTITASTSTSGCGPYIYFDTSNPPTTNQTTYSVTTAVTLYAYVHGCPGYADSTVASASYTISSGQTYYMSPTGSDSNSGTSSSSPWLTPNHSGLNCNADMIQAAAGTYSTTSIGQSSTWGAVTCPAGHGEVLIVCAVAQGCNVNATTGLQAVYISASYWGISGFVASATGTYGTCFVAEPKTSSASIHDIAFIDDIASGCTGGGFNTNPNGSASVDYVTFAYDIAYNAASGASECYQGFTVYEPINTDTTAGTHIVAHDDFAWDNVDGPTCGSSQGTSTATDGEGFIADTVNGLSYTGQFLLEDNIFFRNGGRGIEDFDSSTSPFVVKYNTLYGNNTDGTQSGVSCGELLFNNAKYATASNNIMATTGATACDSLSWYDFIIYSGNSTNTLTNSYAYSPANQNYSINSSSGFTVGSGMITTNPSLSSPADPGAPACSGFANILACMSSASGTTNGVDVISAYAPTASGASAYGYQPFTEAYDAEYPQALCGLAWPYGLLPRGCAP